LGQWRYCSDYIVNVVAAARLLVRRAAECISKVLSSAQTVTEILEVGLAIFSRAPVPSQSKRRLIPALGAQGAAALQARMTQHVVSEAVRANLAEVTLWCHPDTRHAHFEMLKENYGIELKVQTEGDLGTKMSNALSSILRSNQCALLVGSDCPGLDAGVLREAAYELSTNDAVLGAAKDGGYVLIGVRANDATLFEGMPWGTARVLQRTRERMQRLGWRWHELGPFTDIDRPDDLAELGSDWFE
jgi:rSAM/selenodomain-associated transferase 1